MAYGILINNASGQSILDTRTDKQTVTVASGSVTVTASGTSITSGTKYANATTGGNYTAFGAPNNTQDTVWTATSSGTLTSGRAAPLKIISAPGITSTTTSSSGIIVTDGPDGGLAKQYNSFLPDGTVVTDDNIALAVYTTVNSTFDYYAVRF